MNKQSHPRADRFLRKSFMDSALQTALFGDFYNENMRTVHRELCREISPETNMEMYRPALKATFNDVTFIIFDCGIAGSHGFKECGVITDGQNFFSFTGERAKGSFNFGIADYEVKADLPNDDITAGVKLTEFCNDLISRLYSGFQQETGYLEEPEDENYNSHAVRNILKAKSEWVAENAETLMRSYLPTNP